MNTRRLTVLALVVAVHIGAYRFALRDAELAIKTLAREIPGDESIHSCLLPGGVG